LFFLIGISVVLSVAHRYVVYEYASSDTPLKLNANGKGNAGENFGDGLVFSNNLYRKQDNTARPVGRDQGWCTRTQISGANKGWECRWTAMVEHEQFGQISVEGPFYDNADSILSITGGTNFFMGITGELRLHALPNNWYQFNYTYYLPTR